MDGLDLIRQNQYRDVGTAPDADLTIQGSKEDARKRRHREHMKLKHKADKQRQTQRNQTFESRSCHCAAPCSPTRTDFCELYEAIPLPVTSDHPKTWAPSVRLIRLKSGGEGDPVKCDLFSASLTESHRFTALSYVWGNYNDKVSICVNDRVVTTTRNLYAAMVHLRDRSAEIILWVDALCINQGNLPERTSQVEHMPQIYGTAAEVIAWLGEEAHGSGEAMDYISSHAGATNETSNPHQKPAPLQLEPLWSRPYWGRVWVVQELASAHRSGGKCIIKCGHQFVSFDQFRCFLGRFLADQFYTGVDSVRRPKHLINLSIAHEKKSFLEILSESASLEATDPRDRIYGIRGISPEFYRNRIPVDYQISFQELCKKVIAAYIKKEKKLDILCQFRSFPRSDHYPSWVRDLSNCNRGISLSIHSASAGSQSNSTVSDNILHARGKCIGTVNILRGPYEFPTAIRVGQPWPDTPNLDRLEHFVLKALKKRHGGSTPGDLQVRFMNMVSGDRWRGAAREDTRIPFAPRKIWDSVRHYEKSSVVDEQTQVMYRYFTFLFSPLIGRTLFNTAGGTIGIGPPNMQKDDMLCVLYGCSYCVVLRKVKQRHYIFIGPAYVDDAMSGEYVRQEHDDEGRQNVEEQFHIR
ncbi:hypothetical protein SUNI508_11594 [Seiridium unicorne]|uniref:Heterokaryon incompatibility domain-containing protein n=1 Tax=Seiridium unicorne TaxID=138068 RepID=A0ABR2UGW7_9PEZI